LESGQPKLISSPLTSSSVDQTIANQMGRAPAARVMYGPYWRRRNKSGGVS